MATHELRKRSNWQTTSGAAALEAEAKFHLALQNALDNVYPDKFQVDRSPTDFNDIYSTYELPQETLEQINNIDLTEKYKNGNLKHVWGIEMDFAIRNLKNNKVIFGEIKRQDGWIEGTESSTGRGNAHERSCKYFTPGLMKAIKEKSNLNTDEILPFWLVLIGDITKDPKRNREIAFWYQGFEKNYYMWRDTEDVDSLLDFFENNLLPYLL